MKAKVTYGVTENRALLSLMPAGDRVLDIGCGQGAWSDALRRAGAKTLVGIEPSGAAAAVASRRYDRIVTTPVENVSLDVLGGKLFDLIVAADLLEHLVDPWTQLKLWRSWIAPDGFLAVSVPNLRDLRIVWQLVAHGEFSYSDRGGLMDRTHLRWFTRKTLDQDLLVAGWTPARYGGLYGPIRHLVNQITLGQLESVLAHQLHVIAHA